MYCASSEALSWVRVSLFACRVGLCGTLQGDDRASAKSLVNLPNDLTSATLSEQRLVGKWSFYICLLWGKCNSEPHGKSGLFAPSGTEDDHSKIH